MSSRSRRSSFDKLRMSACLIAYSTINSALNVQFVRGAVKPADFPPEPRPFVLVAGRSNCGKSSLLNAIFNNKTLARTSKTPGRTTELNFFDVAGRWFVVDLPGYGYAAQSNEKRGQWGPLIDTLMADDRTRVVLILSDIRRGLQEEEVMLEDLARHYDRAFLHILTKGDKIGRGETAQILSRWRQSAPPDRGLPLVTAARTRAGIPELSLALETMVQDA